LNKKKFVFYFLGFFANQNRLVFSGSGTITPLEKGGDENTSIQVNSRETRAANPAPQTNSALNSISCPLLFSLIKKNSLRYAKNVLISGGLRTVFKPVSDIGKHLLPGQRWLGLWTPAEKSSKIMKALDGYYLRQSVPLLASKWASGTFYNLTPQHLIAQLTHKAFKGKSYTFSFPAHMWVYAKTWAPVVTAGISLQTYLTWELPHENEARVNIEKDPTLWNDLIENDLRFDFIKKNLKNSTPTAEDRFLAWKKLESIKLYFNTLATDEFLKMSGSEREAVLLENPLFAVALVQEDPDIRSKVIRNVEYTLNQQALIPELVRSGFFRDSDWTVDKMGSNQFLDLVKKSPLLQSTIDSFKIPVYEMLKKIKNVSDNEYDGNRLSDPALMQTIVLNISQLLQELQMRANVGAIPEEQLEELKKEELTKLLSSFIDQNLRKVK
jgi:hypothetical protein